MFRIGDKVMQNKNNYNIEWSRKTDGEKGLGVFNGDVGFVTEMNFLAKNLTVTFDDDKEVKYEFSALEELELAYAVTVHKSQGSEYPAVVLAAGRAPARLLSRDLLYTAVTRARRLLVTVGDQNIVHAMIENGRKARRYSGLRARLAGEA